MQVGEYIRNLRKSNGLLLRELASGLSMDQAILSKIERGERTANKDMIPILAALFNEDEKELCLILFSDKVAYQLIEEDNANDILKVAEEKIHYLKSKRVKQGQIEFKNR